MGNPKQKWTPEEESALKAGMSKHGTGKWSTILKDPEFSSILFSRSNVDLKDKWRNLRVLPTGRVGRDKAIVASNHSNQVTKHDNKQVIPSDVVEDFDDEIVDVQPLAMATGSPPITAPKRVEAKLESLILEAIINSKESTGSNKTAISMYIEDRSPPSDSKLVLAGKLKEMTETGKLIKVKHNYRIAPSSVVSGGKGSKYLLSERRQKGHSKVDKKDIELLNKLQIDTDLSRMEFMTAEEAAAAAAQAVAEAELAMMEAEDAVRRAEAAETEVEEAEAFAEAAALVLENLKSSAMWAGATVPEL